MKTFLALLLVVALAVTTARAQIHGGWSATRSSHALGALGASRYDSQSLGNPYGAGSRYGEGLLSPYSLYGSPYSAQSWRNRYTTEAPQLYEGGRFRGNLSTNRYDYNSTSNPYGPYGSRFSPDSIHNPYGAGSPYRSTPIYVYPGRRGTQR